MKDTPENWQKAIAIAWRIEEDLQHSDWQKLFDPTFAKYGLKTKYAAELKLAAPIPQLEPEMTVGAMWEEYLIWKRPQLQPTTFEFRFSRAYSVIIKGLVWDGKNCTHSDTGNGAYNLPLSAVSADILLAHPNAMPIKLNTLNALSEAFARLQSLGQTKLTVNPFVVHRNSTKNKTDMYKQNVDSDGAEREWYEVQDTETDPEEKDRRAFTKDDRDTIIKAFYEHKNAAPRQMAPLVEFRFLTGCRNGEAFALRWGDVFLGRDRDKIVFARSYNGDLKNTQVTKTGESRIFKMNDTLRKLLLRIKPETALSTSLVFSKLNGTSWDSCSTAEIWSMSYTKRKDVKYEYPGIVTKLAANNLISGYLPFYNCRHTFISLMAHAGVDLFLLATACGNSIEVIQRHYLGVNKSATFPDI